MSDLRIQRRFNGPPRSAHGGVACGRFAEAVDARRATVRLLAPPPLEVDLGVAETPLGATVTAGDVEVAHVGRLAEPPAHDFAWLPDDYVAAARSHWMRTFVPIHPFPTCFGCGHARPGHDGLELFAGEVPDSGLCASAWTPDESLADGDGTVPDWAVWAAMDCPSGSATFRYMQPGEMVLLGELSVAIESSPSIGGTYQIVAASAGAQGRRLLSSVSLVAPDGTNLARGRATWIRVDLESLGSASA